MNKKIIFIDAMALTYKAYFAFISRPLVTKKGEPTSAVFGFITQIIKILEDIKPAYMFVGFDSKEKTFRHDKFEAYKATRSAMPEDMIPQIGRIKEIIEALNIPVFILPGYEADDIIGTAVKKAESLGYDSFMITPDKDYIQLVTENVKLVKPGKSGEEIDVITKDKVLETLGFAPDRMIDYLSLIGDASDNIPGVKGIGPKAAPLLIEKYSTLENIYEHIDEVEPASVKTKLIAGKENAFLSKELATIMTDVPIEIDFNKTKIGKPEIEKIKSIFDELEFKNLYVRLRKFFGEEEVLEATPEVVTVPKNKTFLSSESKYVLVTSVKEAKALADALSKQPLFVFDTETDSLDYFEAKVAGVSFCYEKGKAFFVALNPFVQSTSLFERNLDDRLSEHDFVSIFKSVFENAGIKKVCQNGKFDISIMRSLDIHVRGFYFDTMLASFLLDPDQKHGMDDLAEKYLQYKPIPLSELIGAKKDAKQIFDVELNKLSDYSSEDADITFQLYEILKEEIDKNNLHKLAYEVEFPLAEVLEEMERSGVNIDRKMLGILSKELETSMNEYSEKIFRLAGETFNINSPKQMQKILFEKLQLQSSRKTKTGFSTDAQTLESLRGEHEIIESILDFRQVAKLKSTYADALSNLIHPKTGRVHTSFNQTIASTGRLSSVDPNLQNIPIRTELGREIRKAFVPRDKNHCIISCDYSQIELRIMASMSNDERLIEAFKYGEDIHRRTAALVFQIPQEEVTPDMRRKAKEVNFGILYGIGVFGLKTRLKISQQHAKEIIDTYFSTFKNVKAFMDASIQSAREKGFAETLLGRRRFLKNINSKNFSLRNFEERVAINMPIQGTAADMIKLAMINIHNELAKRKYDTKMILQVHDELVFDALKGETDEVVPLVKDLMENALPLNVPILVETGIGDNWIEAH
ncbi:MAG: DNA polymerase I [Ignavibacteriaceae bacterium]|nr:DNA polymerase I [Ignavibacteriaceae bacterium]